MAVSWYRREKTDLVIQLQIQPRASRNAVAGIIRQGTSAALKIHPTAPPVEGPANQHLVTYLAGLFDVPRSHVRLERGKASKHKQIRLHSPKKLPPGLFSK